MRPAEYDNLRDGYVELLADLRRYGKLVSPRGYKTLEIEDACFVVHDTRRLLPFGTGRALKPAIGAAEALLLCGGLASPSLLISASSAFRRFLDGGVLHGAYGPRVRSQFETVVNRLRQDRNTRQAIMTIWDPHYDAVDTRDMPCTLGFGFRLRDDGLHMSSTMRSQDAWLGLAYDLFFFGQLGHTIANVLGTRLTSLRHHAYSLHIYERDFDRIDQVHPCTDHDTYEPHGFGYPEGALDYEFARLRAEAVYLGQTPVSPTGSEGWFLRTLAGLARVTPVANFDS